MRRLLGLAGVFVLALSGCAPSHDPVVPGANPPVPVPPDPAVTVTHAINNGDLEPPPFRVRYADTELVLEASTFCYTTACVDGWDNDPPAVGSPEEIFVFVPVRQFDQLTVSQTAQSEAGEDAPGAAEQSDCAGRRVDAEVESLGDGWWRVRPRGPAASYRFSIFAGGGGGDMIGDLRWTTPTDRPLPGPVARLALIADHDGRPDSYGLELMVTNLPASPARYAALITVTAGNGRSLEFEAVPAAEACLGEGAIYFDGPDDRATAAAQLGDFPFTTTVELELDGVVYTATAKYPDDEIEGQEPSVALEFDPPLPR